jgi:hypothetical protein
MTAVEVYELTTQGGATDFARLIRACESFGPYCLIGGLAVNCYVEPVYTLDAEIVVASPLLGDLAAKSALRIQFTTDERYQDFLPEASKLRFSKCLSKSPASTMSRKENCGPFLTPVVVSVNAKRTNWI